MLKQCGLCAKTTLDSALMYIAIAYTFLPEILNPCDKIKVKPQQPGRPTQHC